ncbi:MAG: glutamate--tRNA ligase [Deltaproteobacteria bacterium]|nr:glutamate--tRNA ligase [Deltaproteobacteria bacterium]RLA88367.1 MAG: glutamate--tRNA ligase [Deltaproteobacteria bacterium]
MKKDKVRVRFAPSPSGFLHIGNARTALYNKLFAQKNGGSFILRIEDTDVERSSKEAEQIIMEDLKWLKIDWDEGPDIGGNFGPYRQSERISIYKDMAQKLLEDKKAYFCFCTPLELEEMKKEQIKKKQPPRYNGRCLSLTKAEIEKFLAEGRKPAIRFHVQKGVVEFTDLIRGKLKFDTSSFGDFVIIKSDGMPSYNFAVVVDDAMMKITHVIRGEDHISNTPRQILLYKALNFTSPLFAHHSITIGKDNRPLSKREKNMISIRYLREKGYLAEAIIHYIAMLGWLKQGNISLSWDELVENFSLEKVSIRRAMFDEEQLKRVNHKIILEKDPEELAKLISPFIGEELCNEKGSKWIKEAAELLKDNIITLEDARAFGEIFKKGEISLSDEAAEILENDKVRTYLRRVASLWRLSLPKVTPKEALESVKEIGEELNIHGKNLYMPIRAALTGKLEGPELYKIITLMDNKTIISRLFNASGTGS